MKECNNKLRAEISEIEDGKIENINEIRDGFLKRSITSTNFQQDCQRKKREKAQITNIRNEMGYYTRH